MLLKKGGEIPYSEVTPKSFHLNRRKFIVGAAAASGALLLGTRMLDIVSAEAVQAGKKLQTSSRQFSTGEKQTPYKDVTGYNNFYEYGTDKYSPSREAWRLRTADWRVVVEGAVKKPRTFSTDDLMKLAPLEERIYRLRCVEGWSMVIPWVGFSLSHLIKQMEPQSGAKYVEFVTLYHPEQMPNQNSRVLAWPYVEGLRLDEAMHPLTLLCFGLYGEALPNQNGAPVRIVVPWKYGFKSAKSIVKIRLVSNQPTSAWTKATPNEYGFYSNVNPNVDHPRWSQAKERRLGEFFKRPTLMFNGYADQVQQMYAGMDLKKDF